MEELGFPSTFTDCGARCKRTSYIQVNLLSLRKRNYAITLPGCNFCNAYNFVVLFLQS